MKRICTAILILAASVFVASAQDRITVDPGNVVNHVSPLLYGSGMEDVNH